MPQQPLLDWVLARTSVAAAPVSVNAVVVPKAAAKQLRVALEAADWYDSKRKIALVADCDGMLSVPVSEVAAHELLRLRSTEWRADVPAALVAMRDLLDSATLINEAVTG